jgi:amino acid transporter
MLTLACTREELLPIIGFIKSVLLVIQILIPIGLIILGTIDLGKAVIASKEDEIKKNQQTLIKRALAAVLVFLLATIVTFLMAFVGGTTWKDCWAANQCQNGVDPITGACR